MQGFNMGRYVPPDQEGLVSANKLAGKHALGARARHLQTKGALIVRFEMPFATWCTNCNPEAIIGQGVRFNAEKKKVGNYYSTPIYSFRMKHAACGGWIEIRTDPKTTAYIVTEGGRKRDTGEDKLTGEPGEIRIKLGGERSEEEKDAFARLEGKVEDKRQFDAATTRIHELQKRQSRDWDDPYEQSRRLRRTFRTERKRLEKVGAADEALKDKMSLGIDLLEETESDRVHAGLIDFGLHDTSKTQTRPMFGPPSTAATLRKTDHHDKRKGKLKSEALVDQRKALLSSELRGNTRAVIDPFLNEGTKAWQPALLKMRKSHDRKMIEKPPTKGESVVDESEHTPAGQDATIVTESSTTLVAYGSDSE